MPRFVAVIFSMILPIVAQAAELPHLPPDMDGFEYRNLFAPASRWRPEVRADDPLAAILELGRRNLSWLETVNAARSPTERLELTTPETTIGYPLDRPNESNRTIILARRDQTLAALPESLRAVLLGNAPLPTRPPLDDAVFLLHVRAVDKVYQAASRWLLQEPFLSSYAERAAGDVRGYAFLKEETELDTILRTWRSQPETVTQRLSSWLIGLCMNANQSHVRCARQLTETVEEDGDPRAFRDQYWRAAEKRYAQLFAIQNPRRDAVYSLAAPNSLVLPFRDPQDDAVRAWLMDNIEDEWRLDGFQLRLDFQRGASGDVAHVVFVPGATPNVNGLGGSRITMDANRSLDEYLVRWTIRHEFGHVLGFPDCYVEFYDAPRGVMVNYQVDLGNIMCSRLGRLQPIHHAEIARAYGGLSSR